MKRKLALLLAFVMAFSILPMAVGASFTGVTPTAQRTGSLWEAQGVATNVRHWGDGVLVAREDITRVITGRTGLAPAPTGNLRHIMVAADYFVGATGAAATQASLLVQLQNAASFAIASHGDAEMRALQVEDAMPGLLNWLNTPNPPTILPITPRARNDLWPGTWELPGNITQNTTPGSINTVPSLPPAAAFPGDVALTGSGTEDSPLTRGRRIIADAQAAVVYDQGNSWTWAMPFEVATQWGTGATWSTDTIIWLTLNGNLVRAQDGTDIEYLTIPSGIETLAGETINTRNARLFNPLSVASNTGAWDFDLEALVPAPPTVLAATAPVGITTPNMSSLMPFQSDILQVIGNDAQNVIAFNIINVGPTGVAGGSLDGQDAFFVAALVRSATAGHRAFTPGNNQAFLYIWRTPNFPMTPEGVHVGSHFIGLPIEFVTNSDTNSGPVHLLFTHHGGWAQAGQAAFRTDITAVTEATFQITRNGGPRNFHRYGTVLVGGTGRTDGIRIREGAQGAFDQTEWFVEIEIITPGFFWTAFSEDVLRNQNNRPIPNWQGAPAITTRYTVGGAHLGPDGASNITVHDVRRGPDGAASVTNRWNTLYFGITIPNATNLNRLVNDEINIRGLHIGADDRARAGIVEADVRFFRAGREAIVGGTTGFMWNNEAWATDGPAWRLTPEARAASWNALPSPGANQRGIVSAPGLAGPFTFRPGTVLGSGTPAGHQDIGIFATAPFTWGGGTGGRWTGAGDAVQTATVTIANFGNVGLEWFVHENDDAADFVLRSGMQEWLIDENVRAGGGATGYVVGAVVPNSPDNRYHLTARGVLRETVAGSMPGTGASPITFTFNEGIEILGVRMATNDAHFSRQTVNENNRSNMQVWFNPSYLESDNFFAATLGRNTVTLRPEIGRDIEARWQNAQITMEFYLSVMPGFEHFFGFDEIEVTASANVDGMDWEETITIAYAWDPITIETSPVQLDDQGAAVAGIIRNFTVNDVIIHEVEAGALYPGTRLWIGVEGGVSRSWGSADHLSIGSFNVTVEGDDWMEISPARQDSHGTFVEIVRSSRSDGARIVFSDIQVAGNVFPDRDYNVFVADSAVAANWDGFNWINAVGGIGFSRGAVRGFFPLEPYAEPLFSFAGAEVLLPPPVQVAPPAPAPLPGPVAPSTVPVTIWQNQPYIIRQGAQAGQAIAPAFSMVPFGNSNNASSFISVTAIADILGWGIDWNPVDSQATFTLPDGRVAVFTSGSPQVTVNGAAMNMVHADGTPAAATIMNDRLMVHIRFFEQLGVNLTWLPATGVGNAGILVTP